MIDAGLQRRWVDGLRSGAYRQGKHALRTVTCDGDRHCCLGVLCDIANPNLWNHRPNDAGHFAWDRVWKEEIPMGLIDRVGLAEGDEDMLVEMNDVVGKTFAEIADHLERLFGLAPAGPDPAALDDVG